jgi:hypothetical protein
MTKHVYTAQLQAMIDRAGRLTQAETDALGDAWKGEERIQWVYPNVLDELNGEVAFPAVTNGRMVGAWDRVLAAAGEHGQVDAIEAAEEAGRAAKRDERHVHASEYDKDGAEEAVRAAVLAVGVRDLVVDADYQMLTLPWRGILGDAELA